MGFLFSTRDWLLFLNGLNVWQGFLVYYIVFYGTLLALAKLDLIVFKFNVSDIQGTFGLLLVFFAIAATINWTNPYIQWVMTGSFSGATGIFYQAEDGVCWMLANQVLGIQDVEKARLVAFSVIPAIVAFIGLAMVKGKVKFNIASA